MDNMIRALCQTLDDYLELHLQCWSKSPDEVKELMTMKFPMVQTTRMQFALKDISRLPFDTKAAAAEILEYQRTHRPTPQGQNAQSSTSPVA